MIGDALSLVLLFGAGLVAGALNVVAGGGSFLTLPLLIFLGLPPGLANGTNRVGILCQNIGAVWSFRRHGLFDRRALVWAALPATLGAILGAWLALQIEDRAFQKILAGLMVAVALWTFLAPRPKLTEDPSSLRISPFLVAGFFAAGVYGGFVQAGVGFFILTLLAMAGLDMVRGNAVKVMTILCFTVLSLGVFAWQGQVHWVWGLILASGTSLGGLIGVRLTVLRGEAWVRKVVLVMVIVFAIRLWWTA